MKYVFLTIVIALLGAFAVLMALSPALAPSPVDGAVTAVESAVTPATTADVTTAAVAVPAPAPQPATDRGKLNPKLLNLPPNIWVKLHEPLTSDWHRQAHAGIAYDSRRGTLLIFGSDTHGTDWDNTVHEFDPRSEHWTTHYAPAPQTSYRADEQGHAIAGDGMLLPWAIHTYDNIVYDPTLDAIVVTAVYDHNPIARKVPAAKLNPTWIYDLGTHTWRIFPNNGQPNPEFFAASSAYDAGRDTLVAYKWGVWELGPERKQWVLALKESHHKIHHTLEYDSKQRKLAVFGDSRLTNDIWVYTPGVHAGTPGTWEMKTPLGDDCPKDQHFPVAFDKQHGVFLLVPDQNGPADGEDDADRRDKAQASVTCVYELGVNRYTRLPAADLPPLGMNYMMVYDVFHHVFLLVTGERNRPPVVWALRLDPGLL